MKPYVITGQIAREAICRRVMAAPEGSVVVFRDATRTLEQNAHQWPILEAIAEQVEWSVNGEKCFMSADDWKDLLTAAFKKGNRQRVAPGVDGGYVMLGARTSKMGRREFSDWLDFLLAFCAERNVNLEKAV